ncbi:MAG: ABC transporter permease [Acidobacteriota bacterium]|nr:ABC transporter permease [Acidobacteriota bacterium]
MLKNLVAGLRTLLAKRMHDREMDEELRAYIDAAVEEKMRGGMSRETAIRKTRIEMGSPEAVKDEIRDAGWERALESLWQDVRYGARMLRKSPGFCALVIFTLARGIGANTAIFSLVEAVLLRPLPYPHASRLVDLWARSDVFDFPNLGVSLPDLADIRAQSRSFERLAVYNYAQVDLTGQGRPQELEAVQASPDFFPMLGIAPLYGRTFIPSDARPGNDQKAILSASLWRTHFGADTHVIGRGILLNGATYTIIGIMPPEFAFPSGVDLWIPFVPTPAELAARDTHGYPVVGRLLPGSSIREAQVELNTIATRLAVAYPQTDKGWGFSLRSAKSDLVNNTSTPLLVLFAAVGLVLLIVCANVGSLYLARAWSRAHEMAIRAALGASRGRLIRQLLIEGLLLALAGGVAGLLFAAWALEGLRPLILLNTPRLEHLKIDGHVLWFTLAASLAAGLLFGLVPAFLFSRNHLIAAIREAGAGREARSAGPRQSRLRQLFVVIELSLALVLVIAAGLAIRSFARLSATPLGFRPDHVLTMELDVPSYQFKTPAQFVSYSDQVLERIRRSPGVESASASISLPLGNFRGETEFRLPGRPANPDAQGFMAGWNHVTPGYFQTLGISVIAGRDFNENDRTGSEPVVIVNQALARRYFGNQSPIGKQISTHHDKDHPIWSEIVGEVANVRDVSPSQKPAPFIYEPYAQNQAGGDVIPQIMLLVRTRTEPMALGRTIEDRIWSVDKDQPVTNLKAMTELVATSYGEPRSQSLLLSLFGGLGLVLALVGIYGVISYSVGQRTREIGVRMALGAQTKDVLSLVLAQGTKLVLAGVGIGLAASFAATRLMRGLLYGITATDPLTFAGVSALLILAGLAACYIPARRATRVDPMSALRNE